MFGCYVLEACSILKENGEEVDLEEKGDGRSGGRGNSGPDVLYKIIIILIKNTLS